MSALLASLGATISQKGRKAVGYGYRTDQRPRDVPLMTRDCCRRCRLRFAAAATAYLPACPQCGEPLETLAGPEQAVGLQLYSDKETVYSLGYAIALAMAIPDPGAGRK